MKIICNVTRGKQIESVHDVCAVALNEEEKIIFKSGNPAHITCIRSALKPFQASAAILEGATKDADFRSEEIHVQIARGMAKKLGLDQRHYECGSHAPHDRATREEAIKSNTIFTPFHNNCSGKHSGMLALAKKLKANLTGYTKTDHPVQQTIFKQITRLTNHNHFPKGIDGCSAPTPFLSLQNIAKLFQKLGSGKYPELSEAYSAMVKHPYLIGGKNRFDTEFNYALNGRGVCKAGGEAIRGVVIKTKKHGLMGIAIKVLDGNQRAIEVATMAVLKQLNVLKEEEKEKLLQYELKQLYNHRKSHIGDIKATIKN